MDGIKNIQLPHINNVIRLHKFDYNNQPKKRKNKSHLDIINIIIMKLKTRNF